eukprot:jgi/Pico_ML_1/53265/g3837.t1
MVGFSKMCVLAGVVAMATFGLAQEPNTESGEGTFTIGSEGTGMCSGEGTFETVGEGATFSGDGTILTRDNVGTISLPLGTFTGSGKFEGTNITYVGPGQFLGMGTGEGLFRFIGNGTCNGEFRAFGSVTFEGTGSMIGIGSFIGEGEFQEGSGEFIGEGECTGLDVELEAS